MSESPSFLEEEIAAPVLPDVPPHQQAEEPAAALGEETPVEPPSTPEPDARQIPISALLDEREKRQRAEREAEELRKQIEAQRQPQQVPDFYDDPEARLQMERQQTLQLAWSNKLDVSEMLARERHGEETVEAAKVAFIEACQTNPSIYSELQRQQNPYGYVVAWHKRQSVLAQMGDDPDKWIEQQIATRLQSAQTVQPKPPAPPPSISSATTAGGNKAPVASGFSQLFGD
jgi:hypothetical protein